MLESTTVDNITCFKFNGKLASVHDFVRLTIART